MCGPSTCISPTPMFHLHRLSQRCGSCWAVPCVWPPWVLRTLLCVAPPVDTQSAPRSYPRLFRNRLDRWGRSSLNQPYGLCWSSLSSQVIRGTSYRKLSSRDACWRPLSIRTKKHLLSPCTWQPLPSRHRVEVYNTREEWQCMHFWLLSFQVTQVHHRTSTWDAPSL